MISPFLTERLPALQVVGSGAGESGDPSTVPREFAVARACGECALHSSMLTPSLFCFLQDHCATFACVRIWISLTQDCTSRMCARPTRTDETRRRRKWPLMMKRSTIISRASLQNKKLIGDRGEDPRPDELVRVETQDLRVPVINTCGETTQPPPARPRPPTNARQPRPLPRHGTTNV